MGYNELKQRLAAEYRYDRGTYTAEKNSFIEGVIARAGNVLET
jgi:GrpB-like predicted nucleotidyltransferase (UPF0157 family)